MAGKAVKCAGQEQEQGWECAFDAKNMLNEEEQPKYSDDWQVVGAVLTAFLSSTCQRPRGPNILGPGSTTADGRSVQTKVPLLTCITSLVSVRSMTKTLSIPRAQVDKHACLK